MKTSYTLTCTEQPSYLALSNLGPVFQGLQNVLLLCGAVVGAYLLYWALERAYLLLKLRNLRKQRITLCADSAKLRSQCNNLIAETVALRGKCGDLLTQASVIRDSRKNGYEAHKGNDGENDPKLSDRRGWRDRCVVGWAKVVGRKQRA